MLWSSQLQAITFSAVLFSTIAAGAAGYQAESIAFQAAAPSDPQNADPLQQLIAPIALYPDALVVQILAAATFPVQIVEAERWMQQNSGLQGPELAQRVDAQEWDASVKALVQFPAVLANMDRNLAWASALGDAYVNQQQDVMNSVQALRRKAQQAGNLNGSSQENVKNDGPTIQIAPADPEVVYVPEYDPWLAYGEPIGSWPDWHPYPGLYLSGSGIEFGLGFPIGVFGRFGWGWHHWRADWHHGRTVFDQHPYVSRTPTFTYRGNGRGVRGGAPGRGFGGHTGIRGVPSPRSQSGLRSGPFSGFDHGGVSRGLSSRGQSSLGPSGNRGGGFHGGAGGGFHGAGHR